MQKLLLSVVLLAACAPSPTDLVDGDGAPYEELPSDLAAPAAETPQAPAAMRTDEDADLDGPDPAENSRWAPADLPLGRYAMQIEAAESNVCGRMRALGEAGYAQIIATGDMKAPTLWERAVIETDGEVLRIQEAASFHGFMGTRCSLVETVQADGEQTAPGAVTLQVFHAIETVGDDCETLSKIPRCAEEFTLTLTYAPTVSNAPTP